MPAAPAPDGPGTTVPGLGKVFCVGLSRTGTASLCEALRILGFRSLHNPDPRPMFKGDFHPAYMDQYDAFADISSAFFYRDFDREFPGSRFVLTVRDPAGWARSLRAYWARKRCLPFSGRARMRRSVYGSVTYNGGLVDVFRRWNQGVVEYFRDRPKDLLVMDICADEGWEKLCPFVGHAVPEDPFPHLNAADETPDPP